MSEIELKARELLASCLNEWGNHQEAANVRDSEDLESYEFELRVIGQLLRFGFDTGHGHATRAPQWQPISSAPKDGRPILLHSPAWRVKVVEGGWDAHELAWRVRAYGCPASQPTHFQPLPAPPEVEQ